MHRLSTAAATVKITGKSREIVLKQDVWRALTSPEEFSAWFDTDLNEPFEAGRRFDMTSGKSAFYVVIERIEPEHALSWRWHPGAASVAEDGTTLVEFHLAEVADGTMVAVTETGFDAIALARRAKAFEEIGHGWEMQLKRLKEHAS